MKSTAVIDSPGVFMIKSREQESRAILNDCSFDGGLNFNLLSLFKLPHKQGWKIMCGDESIICIHYTVGRVTNFDIVIPTENGAVYSCKFKHRTEIMSVSTD